MIDYYFSITTDEYNNSIIRLVQSHTGTILIETEGVFVQRLSDRVIFKRNNKYERLFFPSEIIRQRKQFDATLQSNLYSHPFIRYCWLGRNDLGLL